MTDIATPTIHFYLSNDEHGYFSNFSRHPVYLKGKRWPTSEHYFQAQKFCGTEHEEQVRLADKPMHAARMGRERSRPLRKDWDTVKDSIMKEAVMAKFTQHAELKQRLLNTGNALLVERTANDHYWGDGGDGSGLNKLGHILMDVRNNIREGKTQLESGSHQ